MRQIALALILLSIPLVVVAEEEPFELFFFDVSTITATHRHQAAPPLGPEGLVSTVGDHVWEPMQGLEGDAIADLIRDTIAPDCWDMGGSVQFRQGGLLLVKCPESVAAEIRSLIAELDSALGRRIRYSVEVSEAPLEGWGAIAAAGFDSARQGGGRTVASTSGVARAGVATAVSVTNRFTWMEGFTAQFSPDRIAVDPVVGAAEEGLAVQLRAWPTADGSAVLLEAFLQVGAHARPVRSLFLPSAAGQPSPGRIQLPDYRFVAASVSGLVPVGGALAVPVAGADGVKIVQVRLLGVDGDEGTGMVVPAGALCHHTHVSFLDFDALTPGVVLGDGEPVSGIRGEDEPVSGIRFGIEEGESPLGGWTEDLMDLVTHNVDPEVWEGGEAWIAPSGDNLFVRGPRDEVAGFVSRLERRFLRPVRVELEIWSVVGPVVPGPRVVFATDDGRLLGGGAVQTIAGRRGFVVAGSSAAYLADLDLEVLTDRTVADPVVGRSFEGLAAQVRPRYTPDGSEVEVDLDLLLSVRRLSELAGGEITPSAPVELAETTEARFDTTVRVSRGGVFVLDAGIDPEDTSRHIALVVRPMAE